MILRVDGEVKTSGVVTGLETRYFITSLGADEASPKRLMDVVRGHWGVENGLHFLKDRW
jgi:predicted transposase YbfD/YdcC